MTKLTKRIVDTKIAEGGRDLFVWDREVKGFGLKVSSAGTKTYVLQYRTAQGRSRRYSIGRHGSPWTCEEARARAIALLRELASGEDPLDAKAANKSAFTIADLSNLYLKLGRTEKPNKKETSWKTDDSLIKRHIIPILGTRPLKQIVPTEISQLQVDIAMGRTATDVKMGPRARARVTGGKGAAARTTAVLKAMLEFAVRHDLLQRNPAKSVELFKGNRRERFLLDREITAIADALNEMAEEGCISNSMATAIRLLLLTGARKQEITKLEWAWVDLDRSCLRLPDSKTGHKVLPLAEAAVEILTSLPRTSRFVLPSTRSNGSIIGLQRAWDRVRRRATILAKRRAQEAGESIDRAPDLSNVRIHDFRHSFASFAMNGGASLFIVGKILGHRQSSTTEIYAHLRDDPLKAVADQTGAKIAAALKAGAETGRMKLGSS